MANDQRRVQERQITLGGRPRFFFGVSDATADDPSPVFLFLLPLGRPRPRFAGTWCASAVPVISQDEREGRQKRSVIASDR